MFGRVRKIFDGAGWFLALGAACFVFALLAVVLEFLSPNIVEWTGQQITGSEQGGIVYYQWHGQSYTVDGPGNGSQKAITVYLDPGNPSHAMVNDVSDRIEAGMLVAFPAALGLTFLIVGGTRNYRWSRRAREDPWERARGQW